LSGRRGRVGTRYIRVGDENIVGVIGLSKTLAVELGPHGSTVNAIAPGYINTERLEAIAWVGTEPEPERAVLEALRLGRLGRPDDLAGVVGVLCSDAGGHVSGATIDVNGGLYFGPGPSPGLQGPVWYDPARERRSGMSGLISAPVVWR
jgi:hypothetical protein